EVMVPVEHLPVEHSDLGGYVFHLGVPHVCTQHAGRFTSRSALLPKVADLVAVTIAPRFPVSRGPFAGVNFPARFDRLPPLVAEQTVVIDFALLPRRRIGRLDPKQLCVATKERFAPATRVLVILRQRYTGNLERNGQ